MHEASDDAEWRSHRYNTNDFLAFLLSHGKPVSPIFSVFGVYTYLFRIDWLHCVDAGVGADFAGNIFEAMLPKVPGSNKPQRCHALNDKLQEFYGRTGTEDKLKNFKLASFSRSSKNQPAKLKGSAAQVRAIIPFVKELVDDLGASRPNPRHISS